jgi:DNA-binding Lrp family transcriptional regulator
MFTTFVLITTEPARISEVAQAIADLPNVAEVYSVTGEYDIIAVLRIAEYDHLDEAIPEGIARIPGVTGTTTILAFRRFAKKDLEASWDIGLS